jgi:PKD repeat protein
MGSSKAFNVSGTIATADTFALIGLASAVFGDVEGPGTAQASFTITADAATPPGHIVTFDLLLSANLGITGSGSFQALFGQIPALVIDMDPSHTSGPVIKNTIQGMGLVCDYTTAIPAILDNYKSIFLCLGVYPGVYALTASQGQLLAGYLDNGGRMYMEGGETWFYDQQTAVHDMFFIDAVGDGSSDLGTIYGEAGSFADGMSFAYTLGNSYVDRIAKASGSSAVEILRNQSPSYVTGVAYDGGTYKTIGVSHEFGGLGGSSCPSTAANLMYRYMVFFGILEDELKAGFSLPDPTKVCLNSPVTFQDNSLSCPDSWSWEFPGGTPATSTLATPQVTYAATGYYTVKQIVQKGTVTDTLVKANYVRVITAPSYAVTPSGPLSVCNNVFVSAYATPAVPDATIYQWAIAPMNAGSMNYDDTTLQVYWNSGYNGAVSINVTPKNACGSGPVSGNLDISLLSAPAVNQEDFDNVCSSWSPVLLGGGSPAGGVYSGNGVSNGYFDPSQVVAGMNYITYSMTAANGCADSVTQSIYVDPCVGIGDPGREDFSFEVFPNPTAGAMHVVVKGIKEPSARMIIVNLTGKEIYRQTLSVSAGEIRLVLDSQEWSRGIYFIRLEGTAGSHSRKLIVD